MDAKPQNPANNGPDLMFCCSGAADTAEIADQAVRTLHKAKEAKMYCLAGIAGGVELMVESVRAAANIVVVDGCDSDCARKTMEKNGFSGFAHLRVTDLGWQKGDTPVTGERIAEAAARIRQILAESRGGAPV